VQEYIKAPTAIMAADCWEPDGAGGKRKAWSVAGCNVVVDQGKGQLFNRAFGMQTASTGGPFLVLHSAATASNNAWQNISASQVASYGASAPVISFATTYAAGLATGSASYAFSAGTQTVSGAAILWYTSAAMGTNAATGDVKMYNQGLFAASQQVQADNTVSVSVSLSFA
jgi:hypothetical protein